MGIVALAALPARLESQIDECKTISLRFRETAKTFLLAYGIMDVIDIDLTCQMAYREWLENNDALTKTQKKELWQCTGDNCSGILLKGSAGTVARNRKDSLC